MGDKPIIFSAPMVRALMDGRKSQTRRVLPKSHPRFPHHNQINMDVLCFDPNRPEAWYWDGIHDRVGASYPLRYAVGDRLYVQEACRAEELSRPPSTRPATKTEREKLGRTMVPVLDELDGCDGVRFLADDAWIKIENSMDAADKWGDLFHYRGRGKGGIGSNVPPSHMPRWASRLTLTVTDVRVQRLQEISTEDAEAEGCECDSDGWRDYLFPSTQCCGTARESYRTLWNSLHGPDAWDANPWVVAVSFTVQHGNIDQIGDAHD